MIKKILLLILLIPTLGFGQEYIQISSELFAGFTQEAVPAFKVDVNKVQKKALMSHWVKYLESQTKMKVTASDMDIYLANAVLKEVGTAMFTIYMHFEELENGTRIYVGFQDSISGFIAPDDPNYSVAIKRIITEESQKVYFDSESGDLKSEESYLKDLEKAYKKLRNQDAKLNKEVQKNQREISKLKSNISINEGVVNELAEDLAAQRSAMNALGANTPEEVRKNAQKELKNTEKKREKLNKQIDKDREKIYNLETEIRELKYEIEKLQSEIDFQQNKVETQRALVLRKRDQVNSLKR